MKKISELVSGEIVEICGVIDSLNFSKTSTGNDFASLNLRDESGFINAKMWDVTDVYKNLLKVGLPVIVSGEVSEYRQQKQLILNNAREVTDKDEINIDKFYEKAPVSIEELENRINKYIKAITNEKIRILVDKLVEKYHDEFYTFPAATRNHHAFVSGLAYHVVSMLDLAKVIYGLYPFLNYDYLYAGVILHDIGKVIELSDPRTPEYTKIGKLVGHIPLAAIEIQQTANELNITGEEIMVLQHLVLSHHGQLSWGSPKVPMTAEAEALHFIDLIDSRMNMLEKALSETEEGEFTKRQFSMENRAFYKSKNN